MSHLVELEAVQEKEIRQIIVLSAMERSTWLSERVREKGRNHRQDTESKERKRRKEKTHTEEERESKRENKKKNEHLKVPMKNGEPETANNLLIRSCARWCTFLPLSASLNCLKARTRSFKGR